MPEKVVEQIAFAVIAGLFVCTGLWMAVRPDAAVEQDPDYTQNATPAQARRHSRVGGIVLAVLGLIGLYVVLVQAPGPVDAVGF